MFTIVDFNNGYYHIECDKAILFFTTFDLTSGIFMFTRMPFYLTMARDAFQQKLVTIFNNLDFCTTIADDMTMWGTEVIRSDHDKHLPNVLQVRRWHNTKLNLDKQQFKIKQVKFFQTTVMFTPIGGE